MTLIKGIFILESGVAAHEVLPEIHRSGYFGLVLKLKYEKAKDKINWNFTF